MQQGRVVFRFESDTEVHCLRELPGPGDFVTHRGELWVASRVEMNDLGALVTCERPERGDARSEARTRTTPEIC